MAFLIVDSKVLVFSVLLVALTQLQLGLGSIDSAVQGVITSDAAQLNFAASGAIVAQGQTSAQAAASGYVNQQTRALNWLDAVYRMQTMSELLVTIAAKQVLPFSIDTAIPTQYLPRGVQLVNPQYPSITITVRHLLSHMSGITDSRFSDYASVSPNSVSTLRSFIEEYMLFVSSGQYKYRNDVFWSAAAGLSSSYRRSLMNIALVAYIVESVLIERPSLLSSTSKTFSAYVDEKICIPMRLTSTFTLSNVEGAFPSASLEARRVWDHTSTGKPLSTWPIHPAFPATLMYYTSTADLGRLAQALFVDKSSAFATIGAEMVASMTSVPGLTSAGYTNGVPIAGYGTGLQLLDYSQVCGRSPCLNNGVSTAFGHVSVDGYGQVALVCVNQGVTSTSTSCSVGMVAQEFGNPRSAADVFGVLPIVREGMRLSLSSSSLVTNAPSGTPSGSGVATPAPTHNNDGPDLLALWIVLGVLIFVFTVGCIWCTLHKLYISPRNIPGPSRAVVPVIEVDPSYPAVEDVAMYTPRPRSIASTASVSRADADPYYTNSYPQPSPYTVPAHYKDYGDDVIITRSERRSYRSSPAPVQNYSYPYGSPSPKPAQNRMPPTSSRSRSMASLGNTDVYGNPY